VSGIKTINYQDHTSLKDYTSIQIWQQLKNMNTLQQLVSLEMHYI